MVKLFDGLPDLDLLASTTGLQPQLVNDAVLEMAFICKTITRLGKGYVLGEAAFSRPGSIADAILTQYGDAPDEAADAGLPVEDYWVGSQVIAGTLADRTGLALDEVEAIVVGVEDQVDADPTPGRRVAYADVELERVVEDQLMADLSVLDVWGWSLTDVQRQVRLDPTSRADLIGRRPDGTWVVIELKRGAALTETADQVLRYIDLVQRLRAGADEVHGLVIADGDDVAFHDRVRASGENVTYLPVRSLNLPACRPQTHTLAPEPGSSEFRMLTVAADGLTAVAATPSFASFTEHGPISLQTFGREYLDGTNTPQPIPPLPSPRI